MKKLAVKEVYGKQHLLHRVQLLPSQVHLVRILEGLFVRCELRSIPQPTVAGRRARDDDRSVLAYIFLPFAP